jgi:hypothetical protein
MTILYFFDGYFGSSESPTRTVFSLKGLNEASPYANKTYADLREQNQPAFNKLNDTVLRAFIVKQLKPEDDTSIYHIFQRLNTGGTPLASQEIRNCIYHGPLNDLLRELNCYKPWRSIFGKDEEDSRQRDIELILRFLALYYGSNIYERPMTDFLSKFMHRHQNAPSEELAEMRALFQNTASTVLELLGERPCRIHAGINAAVFDSIFVAVARNVAAAREGTLADRYKRLLKDSTYGRYVNSHTTDTEVVRLRIAQAETAVRIAD